MAASSSVRLAKLLTISALFYVANSASISTNQGYLFADFSRVPKCFDLPTTKNQCLGLVNYKVADYDTNLDIARTALTAVEVVVKTLEFFPNLPSAFPNCRASVREYACSNIFGVCREEPAQKPWGIALYYAVNRTEKACAKVQQDCPVKAQEITTYNCSAIMRNPMEFMHCVDIPTVAGDICPATSYKFSKPSVDTYHLGVKNLNNSLPYWKTRMDSTCFQEFIDINCQILRGSICSTDGKLHMSKISRQTCTQTMTKCLPGVSFFQVMCGLFPNDTAKRVPLPSNVNSNANQATPNGK